ncbi:MAG: hypothetical protein R3A12_01975 [Ignavibacteria bacterium]
MPILKFRQCATEFPHRDGHTISVSFETEKKATADQILNSFDEYNTEFLKDTGIDAS